MRAESKSHRDGGSWIFLLDFALTKCKFHQYLLTYPRPLVPKSFKRTLLVTGEPPFAEGQLGKEHEDAYQQADRVTQIGCQVEAEGEIDQHTKDGLCHVVGKAHAAIGAQGRDTAPEILALIEQNEG